MKKGNKMKYRKLGKSGLEISVLSFGTMRWNSWESCKEIIQKGLDAGMNYFDTSTGYLGGKSQVWTGKAVKERRSELYFSSKSDWASAPNESDVRKKIEGSLKKTGLDYFDMYQIWGLRSMDTLKDALKKGGMIDGVQKAMNEGLIKHGLGFTFHGTPDVFKAAIDTGAFICTTVSYNLMKLQEEEQIKYAHDNGVGVFIMNPLAGGVLAMAGNKEYDFLKKNGYGTWYGALRFLLANQYITSSLLGLATVEQLDENLKVLDDCETLDEDFRQNLIKKMDAIELNKDGYCTGCEYCEVCPNNFGPSKLMQIMRDFKLFGVKESDLQNWLYSKYGSEHKAIVDLFDRCAECGLCQDTCPQKLQIVDEIKKIKEFLK